MERGSNKRSPTMGKLRDQMKEEMRLRGYADRTIDSYVAQMVRFVRHYGVAPTELGSVEIRKYLVHLTEDEGLSSSSVNQAIYGLKFFYAEVLGREWAERFKFRRSRKKKLPVTLTRAEVGRLLEETRNLKHRAVLMALYSAGLRVNEAISLQVRDLDIPNRRILVREPKGGRERYVMLSDRFSRVLRRYLREQRPKGYLFPGKIPEKPLHSSAVQRVVKKMGSRAGIEKTVTPHVLRHTFATHLIEQGTSVLYIQKLLGHKSVKTTMLYTHVSRRGVAEVRSPLDTADFERLG